MSVISKRRVVSDISITNLSFTIKMVTCEIYQSRDWWVKYQSQTYLPFAFKNVTSEWYINHKPTYHLLSRNVTGEWNINHKPIYHLLSRMWLVSDISITNLPTICYQEMWLVSDISITNLSTICYQERDWWVIYQSQTYRPFAIKKYDWWAKHWSYVQVT